MRSYRFKNWYLLVLGVCMLLMSCGGGGDSSDSSPKVVTSKWQLDGNGYVQFRTNDAQYYDYSFWNTFSQTNEALMTTVTASVIKQSGSLNGGYGIVFCYQDVNNFYRLLIDADGHYSVVARVDGVYSGIISWRPSLHLNSGIGAENVISVSQPSTNNFLVVFNGIQETFFSDGNFTGGRAGFSASVNVQEAENFPDVSEDMRFKLTSPVAYP